MNRRTIIQLMSRAVLGAGAASLLPNCATTGGAGGGGSLPPATKENPFVNSLGMKFVPVPGTKILMCTTETTVSQYKAAGRGYDQLLSFPQGANHPVVMVNWHDAKAWCAWMSKNEGKRYRLPTNIEWSAAVGNNKYPWGNSWPPPNNSGNYSGQELRNSPEIRVMYDGFVRGIGKVTLLQGFKDKHVFTAPVGSYRSNSLGIHDLGGNVIEWTEEACWRDAGHDPQYNTGDFREGYESKWVNQRPMTARNATGSSLGFRCVIE